MNKTTEALKLAEALENDAKEHREVSYGLDCPPERTANWKHALNCEAAARLIREALAEPVKQEPVAVISESAIGLVKLHSNGVSLPFGTQLYAAPVSVEVIRAESLEEAAKVCEEGTALTYFQNTDCYNYAHNRAKAIRSLK